MKILDNDLRNHFFKHFLPSLSGRKFYEPTAFGYSVFEIYPITAKEKEKLTKCVVLEKVEDGLNKAILIKGHDHNGRDFSVIRILVQQKTVEDYDYPALPTLQEIFDEFPHFRIDDR